MATAQMARTVAAYGRWRSPLTAASLTASATAVLNLISDHVSKKLFCVELRPEEKGRSTVCELASDGTTLIDKLPFETGFNARSAVHEYGGGSCGVRGDLIVFTDFPSFKVMVKRGDMDPAPVLSENPKRRFADFEIHPSGTHVVAIQELHVSEHEIVNNLVSIRLDAGGNQEPVVIAEGRDFYAAPRFNSKGDRLAFVSWDLPQMPWTISSLSVAHYDADAMNIKSVTNFPAGKYCFSQPRWSPDDVLHFLCTKSGYYNPYTGNDKGEMTPLLAAPIAGDFAGPDWTLGNCNYDFMSGSRIVASFSEGGKSKIGVIENGKVNVLLEGFTAKDIRVVDDVIYAYGGSPTMVYSLVKVGMDGKLSVIKASSANVVESKYISIAEPITFPTRDGKDVSYAYFYPPKNDEFEGEPGTLPPLIVSAHGGPTASENTILKLGIQYYTSRGFAYLDVQYGGSSGFGSHHLARLDGQWGIVDVDDCCEAAIHVSEVLKRADRKRMSICGGSAGGFTVLACMAFRPEVFASGVSRYGVADLISLAKLTHKFESRYLDLLLGGSVSEIESVYIERSPLNSADRIVAPLLIQQGADDRVVPQNQAELIKKAIEDRGGVVSYDLYAGEGHGWRRAETRIAAVESELAFYLKHFL